MRRSADHRSSRAARPAFGSLAALMAWQKNTRQQIQRWPPIPGIRSRRQSQRLGLHHVVEGEHFADLESICPVLFPFLQRQAVRLEQLSDLAGPPMQQSVKDWRHDAKGVVAENHALRNPRKLFVL